MDFLDWTLATVILLSGIVLTFTTIPGIIQKPTLETSSFFTDAENEIIINAKAISIMGIQDCNAEKQNCEEYKIVKIGLENETDQNTAYYLPHMQYENKIYALTKINSIQFLYLLTQNYGTDINYETIMNNIFDTNQELTINERNNLAQITNSKIITNIDGNKLTIKTKNQENETTIEFDKNITINNWKNENGIILFTDEIQNYSMLMNNYNPEIWLELPADKNITMTLKQQDWNFTTEQKNYTSIDQNWYYENREYRIGISITAEEEKTQLIAQKEINETEQLNSAGITENIALDSIRIIEYENHLPKDWNPDTNDFQDVPYNIERNEEIIKLTIDAQEFDTNQTKKYYVYFNVGENFIPPANYETLGPIDLTKYEIENSEIQKIEETEINKIEKKIIAKNPGTMILEIEQENKKYWNDTNYEYRLELAFEANGEQTQDYEINADVNIIKKIEEKCTGCQIETEFKLTEVNNHYEAKDLNIINSNQFQTSYNEETGILDLNFTAHGITNENQIRYYLFYFNAE